MNTEILFMGFAILVVAWALTRILSKTTSLERHVSGMRKRLNELEQRLVSNARLRGISNTAAQTIKMQGAAPASSHDMPTQAKSPSRAASGIDTTCAFCGEKFDIGLEKCPKCNHINIEKYRVRRKSDKGADDFDV